MHDDWGNGLFLYKAVASGRRFNVLALACLCGTLVAMDGPLLQRASSVRSEIPLQPVTLEISINPEVPSYWTGWSMFQAFPNMGLDFTTDFLPVLREYNARMPISGVAGCSGTCTGTVRAPALAVDSCQTMLHHTNYTEPLAENEQLV